MARARNIKPGFFKNEDLAECQPFARLCFAGLWTMADREGRLEDRPKRIKGELFPYDSVEVEPLLAELERWGFIRRYEVRGERFIFIVNFAVHQAPHGTEKDSAIPDEDGFVTVCERGKNGYATGKRTLHPHPLTVKPPGPTPAQHQIDNKSLTVNEGVSEGGQNALIPDSGFLIPDSLIPEPPQPPPPPSPKSRKPPAPPVDAGSVGVALQSHPSPETVCAALVAKGIADAKPGNADMQAFIAKGATVATFEEAADDCARADPPNLTMRYLLGIVRRKFRNAAAIVAGPPLPQGPALHPNSRPAVEAEAFAKGLPAYDELEQWSVYAARVHATPYPEQAAA